MTIVFWACKDKKRNEVEVSLRNQSGNVVKKLSVDLWSVWPINHESLSEEIPKTQAELLDKRAENDWFKNIL